MAFPRFVVLKTAPHEEICPGDRQSLAKLGTKKARRVPRLLKTFCDTPFFIAKLYKTSLHILEMYGNIRMRIIERDKFQQYSFRYNFFKYTM